MVCEGGVTDLLLMGVMYWCCFWCCFCGVGVLVVGDVADY